MKFFHFVFYCSLSVLVACGPGSTNRIVATDVHHVMDVRSYAALSDAVYIHKFETTNAEWMEMVEDYREREDVAALRKLGADSLSQLTPGSGSYLYAHAAFADYPVVHITHEAALAYCSWLMERYHQQAQRNFEQVIFRLPTAEEWQRAASGGNPFARYAWDGFDIKDNDGLYKANCLVLDEGQLAIIRGKVAEVIPPKVPLACTPTVSPVRSYSPHAYGLYNACGNVAEMLDQPGHTRGGSFETSAYYLRLDADVDAYRGWQEANEAIGMRVVMEVVRSSG